MLCTYNIIEYCNKNATLKFFLTGREYRHTAHTRVHKYNNNNMKCTYLRRKASTACGYNVGDRNGFRETERR